MIERYDSGLLNDFGGGNVDWWWDYIRAEVERCNDFHADIHDAAVSAARKEGMLEAARIAQEWAARFRDMRLEDGISPGTKANCELSWGTMDDFAQSIGRAANK